MVFPVDWRKNCLFCMLLLQTDKKEYMKWFPQLI